LKNLGEGKGWSWSREKKEKGELVLGKVLAVQGVGLRAKSRLTVQKKKRTSDNDTGKKDNSLGSLKETRSIQGKKKENMLGKKKGRGLRRGKKRRNHQEMGFEKKGRVAES